MLYYLSWKDTICMIFAVRSCVKKENNSNFKKISLEMCLTNFFFCGFNFIRIYFFCGLSGQSCRLLRQSNYLIGGFFGSDEKIYVSPHSF